MSCGRTTADHLLGQIYLWISEGQKYGIVLRELSKELESLGTEASGLSTGGNIALGMLLIPFGLAGVGLFSLINLIDQREQSNRASASNAALKAKLENDEMKSKKCNKIKEKIAQLNEELKSESRQKNPDDVDRHVLSELLKALVKPEGLTDPCSVCAIQQFVNDFEKNRLTSECFREAMTHLVNVLQFFDINVSFAAIQIKRDTMAPCGLVGLNSALPEALGNCKRAIEKNDGANASKILKDISDFILEATGKLSESVYEAEKSLAAAVQSQTGRSRTQQYQETDDGYEVGVMGGASAGAGGGGRKGGGGDVWGREHENEDCSENKSSLKKLRMALLNIRSIGKKAVAQLNLIMKLISNHHLDFFLITETWLKAGLKGDKVLRRLLHQNMNFFHQPRSEGRGGGVAIVFSDEFQCRPVTLPCNVPVNTFEAVAAAVQHETWDRPVLIITVYRPPRQVFSKFKPEFRFLLTEFSHTYNDIIVAGDFNIWVDNEGEKERCKYHDFLKKNNLEQFVGDPTHQRGHILDLVMGRNMDITDVIVKDDHISDHSTVYFIAKPRSSKKDKKNDGKYTNEQDDL